MLVTRNEFLNFFPNFTGSSLYISPQILKGASNKTKVHSSLWKFYLLILPNTTRSFAKDDDWIRILKEKRAEYFKLKEKYVLEPNFETSVLDDPLLSKDSETWIKMQEDQKLKDEIRKDVNRAFQELEYFHNKDNLQTLEDILFIFCKTHPKYGYPQGLHEIAAFTLYVMHEEMTLESTDTISFIFNKVAVVPDAYCVFAAIAEYIEPFYDLSTSKYPKTYLVEASEAVQDQIIGRKVPKLAEVLRSTNVPPHTYMMKWFRLLFLFVFDLESVKAVWDIIFSFSPDLSICNYICAAMLIHAQNKLLNSDSTETLELLYRYPVVTNAVNFAMEAVMNMPKSKNNKKAHNTDIISAVSERLTELSHGLTEICTKNGYELALPYVMDLCRTRDVLLGILPVDEMLPLDQAVELFKPQKIDFEIKEEVSKTDKHSNPKEMPNVIQQNTRSKKSKIGDQKILFGDDNNDLFSAQLTDPLNLQTNHKTDLLINEPNKQVKKTKSNAKTKSKTSAKTETKPPKTNPPSTQRDTLISPLYQVSKTDHDMNMPTDKEEVKAKPKEKLKNNFFDLP